MAAAVAERADVAVVTSDNPRTEDPNRIIEEILAGFPPDGACQVEVQPDRAAAIEWAVWQARAGDTVLIAGKGHEDYQIVGRTRRHFDDVEVARACLAGRFAEQRTG
jgi:UDP-N-acetylmuramoyl-L-alanyl-D-glutamate--2,6-diaminopimelate ligase